MDLNVLENNCRCYKCRLLISQQHLNPDAKLSEIVYPVHNPKNHTLFNDTHPSRSNKGTPHFPFPKEDDNSNSDSGHSTTEQSDQCILMPTLN